MNAEPMPGRDSKGEKLLVRLTGTIKADVRAIRPIVNGVVQIVKEMKCAEGKEYEIDMALQEALANAIIHGCGNDPSKTVEFCVACDPTRGLSIVIRDPGPGFDPDSVPDPTRGESLFSEHGRGIFLVNQLMDEVHFERGGTEIHMRKS